MSIRTSSLRTEARSPYGHAECPCRGSQRARGRNQLSLAHLMRARLDAREPVAGHTLLLGQRAHDFIDTASRWRPDLAHLSHKLAELELVRPGLTHEGLGSYAGG